MIVVFSSWNVSRLCTNPQPSPTRFHQTVFTHQNEFAHFNGKSEWVQLCQRSYIIIISCLLLPFPVIFQTLRPETFASPARSCTRQRQIGLKRNALRLFTKPDLLKFLYKSETVVSLFTYIHMYRKDLVFRAFPAEAPASPESSAG